jgi:hypothetical protein
MSQLQALCDKLNVRCDAQWDDKLYREDWKDASPYRVTLHFEGRRLTVPFYMGPAHTSEPKAADVLACLCSDVGAGEQSFEDFCSDLGYDADSRKAEKTWKACAKLAPKIRRLLGDHFDQFAGAEH